MRASLNMSSQLAPWRRLAVLAGLSLLAVGLLWSGPTASQVGKDEALPGKIMIDIDAPDRALYKIAIPNLFDSGQLGATAADVVRNDLRLVSLFQVLDTRSFIADLQSEGLSIGAPAWSAVGAQGVVKGQIVNEGAGLRVEMRLFEVARGSSPILSKTYRGTAAELRGFMHDFANEIVRVLTGQAGVFNTRLTFARRMGPGRKDVFIADFDGENVRRVSSGKGIAMLPTFGADTIWYSVLTPHSMFITSTSARERPVVGGNALNMGVTTCNGRLLFSSTRDGNSEIYSAALDGSNVRRLTNHPGIDVSPSCGPNNQIAFVSSRHGGPQIFVMDGNGGGVRRVTYRGNYNQTPVWCPDPRQSLIAFTGQDERGMDVFTINLKTNAYTRLTQGQGSNKDPAFSPDCRMVAFASTRGGVFVSNPDGMNQQRIISGDAETIRWSRR